MKNKRIIRKRQFDTTKPLRFFRTFDELFQYTSGENISDTNLTDFIEQEKYENRDKITSMFNKKKANVPIPDINNSEKKSKEGFSDKSATTELSLINRTKDEEAPVEFYFKPMHMLKTCGTKSISNNKKITINEPAQFKTPAIPFSYIKYKPKMKPINIFKIYDRIDYLIAEDHWEEIKNNTRGLKENHKDLAEEIIDKLEKYTDSGPEKCLEECKDFLSSLKFSTTSSFPSDAIFSGIYNTWIELRKKYNNPLIRSLRRRPDPNDNSLTACYKLRFPEVKTQKRKKNKNNINNYVKVQHLRKEIIHGRNLLLDVMKREKIKQELVNLEYMEVKQMIKEGQNPEYQCEEFNNFCMNEKEKLEVDLTCSVLSVISEDEPMEKEDDNMSVDLPDIEYFDKPEQNKILPPESIKILPPEPKPVRHDERKAKENIIREEPLQQLNIPEIQPIQIDK